MTFYFLGSSSFSTTCSHFQWYSYCRLYVFLSSNIKILIIPTQISSSTASAVSNQMNLDALSIALAQISFTIKNLTKKNFKTSSNEIANVCFIKMTCFYSSFFICLVNFWTWIWSWTSFVSNFSNLSRFTINRSKWFINKTFRKYLFKLLVTRNSIVNIETKFCYFNLLCFRYRY